jgi:hypothetical protein
MEAMTEIDMLLVALIEVQALLIAWAIYPYIVGRRRRSHRH